MPWQTSISTVVTAENQRQIGLTGNRPCSGLAPNSLVPIGWTYATEIEVDAEGAAIEVSPETLHQRTVLTSPSGQVCVVDETGVEVGAVSPLILLGAAVLIYYLWRK